MGLKVPKVSRRGLKPYAAEFLGTALLILIGEGVIAQVLLSDFHNGTWLSINLAWAGAVSLTSYLSDPSPSVNPAVTLAMALVRPSHQHWREVPGKLLAQFAGAFVGAALVYGSYRSAILAWDPEYTIPGGSIISPMGHHSAGIFATYPSALLVSNWEAVLQEVLASGVLMFCVLSIAEGPNARFGAPQVSVFVLMVAIGAAMGWQTGYAINPARDFGPRVFSAIMYGREVFTSDNYYFVVPLLAPVVGCLGGAVVYDAVLYEGEGSVVRDAADKVNSDHHGPLRLLD
ncbi:putative glycerol uptake facilitator [Diplodia seriata]|uniref:Putative glycerol uptake facilitator n=1 Tax=Diplodia seriata TaxID=420778 RepID=A0A0G2DTM7_9PEZI|nr:putative glycerol uptake facilitator [Diplodia seriata]